MVFCIVCGKEISGTGKTKKCRSCAQKGKVYSNDTLIKLRNSAKNKIVSNETKKKISATMSGKNNPMFGKTHSKEARQKIRMANIGEKNPNYGKPGRMTGMHHTKETRNKMRAARIKYMKYHTTDFISKSANEFLYDIEKIFNITIEREFELENRFFDGKWNNNLIEVDGKYWHSLNENVIIDTLKNDIAVRNGYKLHRFLVNNTRDIKKKLIQYKEYLESIFVK